MLPGRHWGSARNPQLSLWRALPGGENPDPACRVARAAGLGTLRYWTRILWAGWGEPGQDIRADTDPIPSDAGSPDAGDGAGLGAHGAGLRGRVDCAETVGVNARGGPPASSPPDPWCSEQVLEMVPFLRGD